METIARQGVVARLGSKAYGLGFVVLVGALLVLSVAAYLQVFTPVVRITLDTDRIGSQLQEHSDVKIRGLIVGEVRSIDVTASGARLGLALKPEYVSQIPQTVSARLLPKTLFGERFVDLVPDTGVVAGVGGVRAIRAGDVIPQDRTSVAIELEQVFDTLLPLLRTVDPAKLSTTLNALATTLDGRGKQLGNTLVVLDTYLKGLNPSLPTLQTDISGLADLASTYSQAAPDLVSALTALLTTNRTIVEKQDELAGFLAGTAGFANTATAFLSANEQRIIQVGKIGRPTLAVLSKYAPTYPCMAEGLADWIPRVNEVFSGGSFHITMELVPPRPAYVPGEEPAWGENRPATCDILPDPRTDQSHTLPGKKFDDGTKNIFDYPADPDTSGYSAIPSSLRAPGAGTVDPDAGLAGTQGEQQVVAGLLAAPEAGSDAVTGGAATDAQVAPSAIQTLLYGPMMRGSVVSQ